MDCIDFSTNRVVRPFGAAKAKPRPINPPNVSPPKFTMPKAQPPKGGVKLIPRVSPITPTIVTNPYTDRIATGYPMDKRVFLLPRQSPATAPQKSNPRGLRFF